MLIWDYLNFVSDRYSSQKILLVNLDLCFEGDF